MNYKKDALFNTIGNFSYLGALWLMSIFVVRIGDFEKAGYFSLALTTANIYIALASYTVRLYYAADLSRRFTDSQYVLMRAFTTALSAVLCVLVSAVVGYDRYQILVIVLFYVYKIFEMLSDILFGALQRHGKLYLAGYSMVIKSLLSLAFFVLALYVTKNLVTAIVAIDLIAFFVLVLIDIPMTQKQGIQIFGAEKKDVFAAFDIMKICMPLFLVGLCYNMVPSIPRLTFERIYSAEQFGIYSSISTVTVLISTAVNCIAVPFVPKYAEYYNEKNTKSLRRITILSLVLVASLGVLALAAAQLIGEQLLVFLFGSGVSGYVEVFKSVIIATVFTSMIICLNDFFVAVERQSFLLKGCVAGVIICGILAYPLCKRFFMNGVAYDLIISQGIEIIILLAGVYHVLKVMGRTD